MKALFSTLLHRVMEINVISICFMLASIKMNKAFISRLCCPSVTLKECGTIETKHFNIAISLLFFVWHVLLNNCFLIALIYASARTLSSCQLHSILYSRALLSRTSLCWFPRFVEVSLKVQFEFLCSIWNQTFVSIFSMFSSFPCYFTGRNGCKSSKSK